MPPKSGKTITDAKPKRKTRTKQNEKQTNILKHRKTSWPSGPRRLTRNQFSVGGTGSNPVGVDDDFIVDSFLVSLGSSGFE